MRLIAVDVKTTGLDVEQGNRIVEIGAVEIADRNLTGRTFHRLVDPQRAFEPGVTEVTGLTLEATQGKPLFAAISGEFLEFVREDAQLILHNASWGLGFLGNELLNAGWPRGRFAGCATTHDTLALAKQRFPGQRNNIDALCRRLNVDNSHRDLHGALLDANLIARIYLGLTQGESGEAEA